MSSNTHKLGNFLVPLVIIFSLVLTPLARAQEAMSSGTYVIQSDSINFAGILSESPSYSLQDTLGEIATGNVGSTNFRGEIGYQAMLVLVASDNTAPSQPPSISANALTSSSIEVVWGESTDNVAVTRYYVYRDGVRVADVGIFPRSFTDTGLSPDRLYAYNVSAVDDALNESLWSATTTARTFALPTSSSSNSSYPIISNLSITTTETQALVKFDTNIPVKASISWGADNNYSLGTLALDNIASTHSFFVPGLSSNKIYFLKINLTRTDGYVTSYSNIIFSTLSLPNVITPPNVTNFEAIAGERDITLLWNLPRSSSIVGVRILRSKNFYPSSPQDGEIVFEGLANEYIDKNVERGVKYYYSIFTKDFSGNYSSGSSDDAYLALPGEEVSPTAPFDDLEIAGDVDPMIASLTLSDFLFIQEGRILSVRSDRVRVDGGKNLTVALRAYRVPPVLKTIAVTLATQEENPKYFTFILRINRDGTRYEAAVAPLGETNTYALKVSVIDFNNQGLKKLEGTLLVTSQIAWSALSPGNKIIFISLVSLILLAILVILIARRRKEPQQQYV